MRRAFVPVVLAALTSACALAEGARAADTPPAAAWPATRRVDTVDTVGGVAVPDPYRWLEDAASPEVQAWSRAQDACARARLTTLAGRDALVARFRALYRVDATSVPVVRGGRLFYVRTKEGGEKPALYWREGRDGAERLLLDPETWLADGRASLGRWAPSWDGKRLAVTMRPGGGDEAVLHVLDVDSGARGPEAIPGARYAEPDWTADGEGFFYEWLPVDPAIPEALRPGYAEVRYHALGTSPARDEVVRARTGDATVFQNVWLGPDGRYLVLYVARGWSENDVYVRDLRGDAGFRLVARGDGHRYGVTAHGEELLVWTNEGAPRGRLFRASASAPDRAGWRELVPEDPEATLQDVSVVGGHLALVYLRDAASEVRITTLGGAPVRTLALPIVGTATPLGGLPDSDEAWFQFSSFTRPPEVYRTSVATGEVTRWARVDLPIDPAPYVVEQVWYRSQDGTRVPMFLVRRRDAPRDGSNRVLLTAYGGFGVSMTPAFRSTLYPWLEAGGMYAVANVRGGGEYGEAWHAAGRGANKQNAFDDFVAAGEHLVGAGWTTPSRLGITGTSNGGLLTAAVMTQRPDLWGAVVSAMPLTDMVRYPRTGAGRTWVPELGDPDDPRQLATLLALSPYHAVRAGTAYPPLLVLTGADDDRVDPLHARKFVAAVQHATAARADTLLRVEAGAGHGGAQAATEAAAASADVHAFLLAALEGP